MAGAARSPVRAFAALVVALIACWPTRATAQQEESRSRSHTSSPRMLVLDIEHVLKQPLHWGGNEWILFAGSTAAVAALMQVDEPVSDWARERGPTFGHVGDALEGLGDIRSFVLLGGFYAAGAIWNDQRTKNVCLDGLAASAISAGIFNGALATIVGRERPSANEGPFVFRPFHGRSFPSGHVAQNFAVVSVIAASYPQLWVKAVAYGAGAMGAYIRVRRGAHFASDVLAGALIGIAVGRSVVYFDRELRAEEEQPLGAVPGASGVEAGFLAGSRARTPLAPLPGAPVGREGDGPHVSFLPLLGRGVIGLSGAVTF